MSHISNNYFHVSQISVSGGHALADVGHPVGAVDQHGGHVVLELGIPVHDSSERGCRQREQVAVRVGPHADGTPSTRRPQAGFAEVAAVTERGHYLLATGHQYLDDALVHEVHLRGCGTFAHNRVTCNSKKINHRHFVFSTLNGTGEETTC